MEPDFLRFVWRHSWRSQLWILAVTLAIFPLVYLSLELPKRIVNDAIGGGEGPRSLFGVTLERFDYLLALCGLLLLLVAAVNALKWILNVSMGRAGERMLRRLRHALFEHVLRFPMARFRGGRQGELVQAMMGEIDPIGGFVGEVLATPVFQGGLLIVYAGFVFVQDLWLGLAAVATIPLQAWLIPRMQARVIRLNRERAIGARGVADFLGESVGAMPAIHVDGAAQWRLAQLSAKLHRQATIRVALFRRKYAIKVVNNLINQAPPLFFYAVGGWHVIEGRLDLGALVAGIAAQREMASPWREVLVYAQNWTDYTARYAFVVEGFTGGDVLGPERIAGAPEEGPLDGPMTIEITEAGPGCGGLVAPRVEIPQGATVAVIGGRDGPRDALMQMAAGLLAPRAGRVAIGGRRLDAASLPALSAAIGHAPPSPYLLDAPMLDNLAAGLLRAPPPPADAARAAEARATGNSAADAEGDWIDYAAAGAADRAAFEALALETAVAVGLASDLRALALESPVEPSLAAGVAALIDRARAALAAEPDAPALDDLVEPWRRDALCRNATLIENLTFGAFTGARANPDALLARADVAAALAASGALRALASIGEKVAAEFRGLVEATGGDSAVFDAIRGYPRDVILAAAEEAAQAATPWRARARRRLFVSLAARFTPERDRLDVLDAADAERLVALRARVSAALARGPDYAPFDGEGINPGLTLLENTLRGALRYDRRGSSRGLSGAVEQAFVEAGGEGALLRLGLAARAGREGQRLTPGARRRVVLARALLKRPRVLVLEAALPEEMIALARRAAPGATLIYAADEESALSGADLVLRFGAGGVLAVEPARGKERAHGTG
jgi:putative ABC transport system ATP-binding protein